MSTDADLLAALTPHFTPELDAAGRAKALDYYREITGKSYEQLAILLAIQHMLVESTTNLLAAKERDAMKAAKDSLTPNIIKAVYGPNGRKRLI